MKQHSDEPLPLPAIVEGAAAVWTNANELVEEADVLRERGRWARAFVLAHFAREELAKIPLLLVVGVRAAKGVQVPWADVRQLFTDHKSKWQIVIADLIREREYLHQADPERLREELSLVAYVGKLVLDGTFKDRVLVDPLWHDNVNRWGRRRFASIYVGEEQGTFRKPGDLIPPGTAMTAVSRSRTAARYYEPLLPAVSGFLADPLIEIPWKHVLAFRTRLLQGGVGGALSNNLLD